MTAEVENPFRPGGELSEEAEGILRHSTISRDVVVIRDPASREASTIEDAARQTSTSGTEAPVEEAEVKSDKVAAVHFSPSQQGVVEVKIASTATAGPEGDTAQEDEVKTERITAPGPTSPAEVQHVQLKKKKGCCAVI